MDNLVGVTLQVIMGCVIRLIIGCAHDRVIISELLIELSCMQDWPGAQKIVQEISKEDEQKKEKLHEQEEENRQSS